VQGKAIVSDFVLNLSPIPHQAQDWKWHRESLGLTQSHLQRLSPLEIRLP
jgi:hypothetical protein